MSFTTPKVACTSLREIVEGDGSLIILAKVRAAWASLA